MNLSHYAVLIFVCISAAAVLADNMDLSRNSHPDKSTTPTKSKDDDWKKKIKKNSIKAYKLKRHHRHKHNKSDKNWKRYHKYRNEFDEYHKEEHMLSISLQGSGSGRVRSNSPGIFCEKDCSAFFADDTLVTLSVTPYSGSIFTGWSGGQCSGMDSCTLRIDDNMTIKAQFELLEPVPLELTTPYVNETDMREIDGVFNAVYLDDGSGQVHDGLDIFPIDNLTAFQAPCSGRIDRIFVLDDLVSVLIQCDANYNIEIGFEPNTPDTGKIQRRYIVVTEGHIVNQGDIVGYLYMPANTDRAHVHFTVRKHGVPRCPELNFTSAARESILNVIAKTGKYSTMCLSADVTPNLLLTPYLNETDMQEIKRGYSAEGSLSPWIMANSGLDIYPGEDLAPFQAACSGKVDTIKLQQGMIDSSWQVDVLIECEEYVIDPNDGEYFLPLSVRYSFRTMSEKRIHGQSQLGNLLVTEGQSLLQGDIIGNLNVSSKRTHLRFSLLQFENSLLRSYGITGIPICPKPHFTEQANESVLNLLNKFWPTAALCYQ